MYNSNIKLNRKNNVNKKSVKKSKIETEVIDDLLKLFEDFADEIATGLQIVLSKKLHEDENIRDDLTLGLEGVYQKVELEIGNLKDVKTTLYLYLRGNEATEDIFDYYLDRIYTIHDKFINSLETVNFIVNKMGVTLNV